MLSFLEYNFNQFVFLHTVFPSDVLFSWIDYLMILNQLGLCCCHAMILNWNCFTVGFIISCSKVVF
jgi:hypothetical protein